jgi:hypothetical protein
VYAAASLLSLLATLGGFGLGGVGRSGVSDPVEVESSQADPGSEASTTELLQPDLGMVRFRDPAQRRMLWFGLGGAGIYLPAQLTRFDRPVWMARAPASWAAALTPWMAIGGRHSLIWYDASTVRTRIHEQMVELSGAPSWGKHRFRDRLSLAVEVRDLKRTRIASTGAIFPVGGVRDVVVGLGYGAEHPVARRWRLGWQANGRLVWVFNDTQRQLRAAFRAAVTPRRGHEFSMAIVGHLVHRDPDQYAKGLPELTVHGQLVLDYAWMSRKGIGVFVRPRVASSFLSGEAPLYEVRGETLNSPFGDVTVGLRARWR